MSSTWGANAHATDKATVTPDKAKAGNNNVLGVGIKAHAMSKVTVPQDKTKMVSLHHARADHRSGFSGTRTRGHMSTPPNRPQEQDNPADQASEINYSKIKCNSKTHQTVAAATPPDHMSASGHGHERNQVATVTGQEATTMKLTTS